MGLVSDCGQIHELPGMNRSIGVKRCPIDKFEELTEFRLLASS